MQWMGTRLTCLLQLLFCHTLDSTLLCHWSQKKLHVLQHLTPLLPGLYHFWSSICPCSSWDTTQWPKCNTNFWCYVSYHFRNIKLNSFFTSLPWTWRAILLVAASKTWSCFFKANGTCCVPRSWLQGDHIDPSHPKSVNAFQIKFNSRSFSALRF